MHVRAKGARRPYIGATLVQRGAVLNISLHFLIENAGNTTDAELIMNIRRFSKELICAIAIAAYMGNGEPIWFDSN